MSVHLNHSVLIGRAEVVAPPALRACKDQNFELPPVLYGVMVAMFFGAVAVMAIGFADRTIVVPMAINFAFLIAFFGVPTALVKATPGNDSRPLHWRDFIEKGISTATGHCSAGEASMLVLLLPGLVLLWALAVVTIAAFV